MAAIDNLSKNIAALASSVDSLTAAVLVAIPEINPIPGTGATEAQVQAAADTVAAQQARIDLQTAAIVKATTVPVTPAAPVIVSFVADVPSGPAGSPRVLTADVTGSPAPTLTLSDGSANPPIAMTGPKVTVNPAVTTTYTLSAVNASGTVTATAVVTVA